MLQLHLFFSRDMISDMNTEQMYAAKEALSLWLANPNVLGHRPSLIRCEGEFDLHDLHYYIFAFKPGLFSSDWLLGVAGGYEGNSFENCGHICSELSVFDEQSAEKEAIRMVEQIRSFWIRKGELSGKAKPGAVFTGCVLLKEASFDKECFAEALLRNGIEVNSREVIPDSHRTVLMSRGKLIAVILIPVRLKEDETLKAAKRNYLWKDASKAAASYTCYALVQVNALDGDEEKAAGAFVTACAALCNENALGVLFSETIYEPGYYRSCASSARRLGLFPVMNMIWVKKKSTEDGYILQTSGMKAFGKPEMRMERKGSDWQEARKALLKAAQYVILEHATLAGGQTIRLGRDMAGVVEEMKPGTVLIRIEE